MRIIEVTRDRIPEASDALALAMLDAGDGEYLVPDPGERLSVSRGLFADLIERALEEGRVDAWGDPIVGVAVWLVRPAVAAPDPASPPQAPSPRPGARLGPDAAVRAERFAAVIRELRVRARPDRHAYLDSIGVLPAHRGRGIATQLLEVGHAWADALGLPCSLETLKAENVEFYERRGYRIVATAPLPDSDFIVTAMRRWVRGPEDAASSGGPQPGAT
jgi:GNAT superfamily N-acetyltransferase